eukprot:331646_1
MALQFENLQSPQTNIQSFYSKIKSMTSEKKQEKSCYSKIFIMIMTAAEVGIAMFLFAIAIDSRNTDDIMLFYVFLYGAINFVISPVCIVLLMCNVHKCEKLLIYSHTFTTILFGLLTLVTMSTCIDGILFNSVKDGLEDVAVFAIVFGIFLIARSCFRLDPEDNINNIFSTRPSDVHIDVNITSPQLTNTMGNTFEPSIKDHTRTTTTSDGNTKIKSVKYPRSIIITPGNEESGENDNKLSDELFVEGMQHHSTDISHTLH